MGAAALVVAANVLQLLGVPYFPACFAFNVAGAVTIFGCLFFIVARRARNYRREARALAVAAAAFAGSLLFQTDFVVAAQRVSGPVRTAIVDSLAEGGLGIAIAALVSLFVTSDRKHTELSRIAESDPLTGLLNRKSFHEAFRKEWDRCTRHGRTLSCCLLDIDFFKRVNDEHGHAAGDAALAAVARLLMRHSRSTDHLCRYGGEEFCILLPETAETDAALWAERVRAALKELTIDAAAPLQITASIGVAQRLDDVPEPDRLVALADEALSAAKQAGRDCVMRYAVLASTDDELRRSVRRDGPLEGRTAGDVMFPLVHCVQKDDTLREAAQILLDFRAGSAPVIDEKGAVVGILSEADVMRVPAENWSSPVAKIMKTRVVSYDYRAPAQDILEFLSRVSIRRVVVLREGRPVGVVSRGGLIQWLLNHSVPQREGTNEVRNTSDRLMEIVSTLIDRGEVLRKQLRQEPDYLLPMVVSEATRIQELTTDLLAQCQAYRGA